jgi:hypothetical protein
VYLPKLLEPPRVPPPPEIIHDEPLHPRRLGRVDHDALQMHPARSHHADGRVVTLQGGGQVLNCVRGADDAETGWGER